MRREEAAAGDLELVIARIRRHQAQALEYGRELQVQVELGRRPRISVVRDLTSPKSERPSRVHF